MYGDSGSTGPSRPQPAINEDNRFWFEGAAAGELRLQRCDECGRVRHPAGPMCGACNSLEWTPIAAAGRGTVYSWTVHHHPPVAGLTSPFSVVLVDLPEGVRVVGNLVPEPDRAPRIGDEVEVHFVADGDLVLPQWRLLDGAGEGADG